jgi:hypothetical protein
LPHFFTAGCQDELCIRSAIETGAWAARYFGSDRCYLTESFKTTNSILEKTGVGSSQREVKSRILLPAPDGSYQAWFSDGLASLPEKVKPAPKEAEHRLIPSIIAELRRGLAIDLEPAPAFERKSAQTVAAAAGNHTLIVGSSNAKRLHTAMLEAGAAAKLIYEPNFRIIRGTMEAMATRVAEAVDKNRPALIAIQLLDNTVFMALT